MTKTSISTLGLLKLETARLLLLHLVRRRHVANTKVSDLQLLIFEFLCSFLLGS